MAEKTGFLNGSKSWVQMSIPIVVMLIGFGVSWGMTKERISSVVEKIESIQESGSTPVQDLRVAIAEIRTERIALIDTLKRIESAQGEVNKKLDQHMGTGRP